MFYVMEEKILFCYTSHAVCDTLEQAIALKEQISNDIDENYLFIFERK